MNVDAWKRRVWQEHRARNLTRTHRDVLLCLAAYCRDGAAWPSHRTLAGRAGCCLRSVVDALQQGRGLGLVAWQARERRNGRQASNLYWLTEPEEPVRPGQRRPECKPRRPIERGRKKEGRQAIPDPPAWMVRVAQAALADRAAAVRRGLAGQKCRGISVRGDDASLR